MKKLILYASFLLVVCSGNAQVMDRGFNDVRIRRTLWSNTDLDFKITQCDEKWKKESAVILCKKYEYIVQKEFLSNMVYEKIYTHTRILLLDKASVNEFSTFKFDVSRNLGTYFGRANNSSIFVGIKVVKPDGSEAQVQIDESLIDEVTSRRSKTQTQKVAVPGLAIGDILDYYYASEKILTVQGYYPFSPVLYSFVEDYPIMKHKIEMHIMRKCFLNARSMNGAPELQFQDDSKRNDMVYTITDIDRSSVKFDDQFLFYPLRELPVLIFQAYFVNSFMVKNNYCFYDKEDVIKKNVSDVELRDFLNNHIEFANGKAIRKTLKYLKKIRKNETNPKILTREAFYFYRQFVYAQNFKTDLARDNFKNYPPSDYDFVVSLSYILRQLNIKNSVIVTVPREMCKMDDLIMPGQMRFLLRLDVDTPAYISAFTKYSLINELDDSFQGNKGKAMEMSYLPERRFVSNAEVPVMKCNDNRLNCKMEISFDPNDADRLLLSRNVSICGLMKKRYQELLITPEEYVKFNHSEPHGIIMDFDLDEKEQQRFVQINSQKIKERGETMEKLLKTDFDITDIKEKKLDILHPGMWEDAPVFDFTDSIEISKFITKAGTNVIVEVGKLIGKQIDPKANDSIQQFNIYIPYAKKIENQISVDIPKGYSVKGVANLAFNVTNETGGFISSAKIEDHKLIILTSKYFTNNYFPKENWTKINAFLNSANDFQNQKVMFVPGN